MRSSPMDVTETNLIVAKGMQKSTTRYQRIEAIYGAKTNLVRDTLSATDDELLEVLLREYLPGYQKRVIQQSFLP